MLTDNTRVTMTTNLPPTPPAVSEDEFDGQESILEKKAIRNNDNIDINIKSNHPITTLNKEETEEEETNDDLDDLSISELEAYLNSNDTNGNQAIDTAELREKTAKLIKLVKMKERDLVLAAQIGQSLLDANLQMQRQLKSFSNNSSSNSNNTSSPSSSSPTTATAPLDVEEEIENTTNNSINKGKEEIGTIEEETEEDQKNRNGDDLNYFGHKDLVEDPTSDSCTLAQSNSFNSYNLKMTRQNSTVSRTSSYDLSSYTDNLEEVNTRLQEQVDQLEQNLRQNEQQNSKRIVLLENVLEQLQTELSDLQNMNIELEKEKRRLLEEKESSQRMVAISSKDTDRTMTQLYDNRNKLLTTVSQLEIKKKVLENELLTAMNGGSMLEREVRRLRLQAEDGHRYKYLYEEQNRQMNQLETSIRKYRERVHRISLNVGNAMDFQSITERGNSATTGLEEGSSGFDLPSSELLLSSGDDYHHDEDSIQDPSIELIDSDHRLADLDEEDDEEDEVYGQSLLLSSSATTTNSSISNEDRVISTNLSKAIDIPLRTSSRAASLPISHHHHRHHHRLQSSRSRSRRGIYMSDDEAGGRSTPYRSLEEELAQSLKKKEEMEKREAMLKEESLYGGSSGEEEDDEREEDEEEEEDGTMVHQVSRYPQDTTSTTEGSASYNQMVMIRGEIHQTIESSDEDNSHETNTTLNNNGQATITPDNTNCDHGSDDKGEVVIVRERQCHRCGKRIPNAALMANPPTAPALVNGEDMEKMAHRNGSVRPTRHHHHHHHHHPKNGGRTEHRSRSRVMRARAKRTAVFKKRRTLLLKDAPENNTAAETSEVDEDEKRMALLERENDNSFINIYNSCKAVIDRMELLNNENGSDGNQQLSTTQTAWKFIQFWFAMLCIFIGCIVVSYRRMFQASNRNSARHRIDKTN